MGLKLIVTERFDPHADIVESELERRGHLYLRFHLDDFAQHSAATYSIQDSGAETLEIRGHRIAIDDVDAVCYRRTGVLDCRPNEGRADRPEWGSFVQGLWQRLNHVRWVSSPAAIRAASNKFDQLIRAKQYGFSVQRLVPKAYDLRIAVFGERVFACRVASPAQSSSSRVDWPLHDWDEAAGCPLQVAASIPDDIAESCRLLVRDYGLAYGAIDLFVTPEGEHVFLELHPNGQWARIEERTGLPLGSALIELLQRAS